MIIPIVRQAHSGKHVELSGLLDTQEMQLVKSKGQKIQEKYDAQLQQQPTPFSTLEPRAFLMWNISVSSNPVRSVFGIGQPSSETVIVSIAAQVHHETASRPQRPLVSL